MKLIIFLFLVANSLLGAISAVTSTGTTGNSTGTNFTISSPSGTTTGDYLVLLIGEHNATEGVTSVSNGAVSFSNQSFQANSSANSISVWTHLVGSGDPSSWTVATTVGCSALMMAYRGVSSITQIDGTGSKVTGSNSPATLNALNTATANAWYVGFFAENTAASNVSSMTLTNNRGSTGNAGANGSKQSVAMGDSVIASAGSSGSFSMSLSAGATYTTYAIALRDASSVVTAVKDPIRAGIIAAPR